MLKWSASSPLSSGPNSAWGSIETTTIGKAHPTLMTFKEKRKLTFFFFVFLVFSSSLELEESSELESSDELELELELELSSFLISFFFF